MSDRLLTLQRISLVAWFGMFGLGMLLEAHAPGLSTNGP